MRLFVAIELSDAMRKTLADVQTKLRRTCGEVRWTQPEQLHITVKFLGEVADSDVAGVSHAVTRAAGASMPFAIQTSVCGCFPERGPVRIVWVSVTEEGNLLAGCVAAVEAQVEPLGFPREHRPFAPHITVGRVRDDRSNGSLRTRVQAHRCGIVEQEVRSLTLMSSVLSRGGSVYTPVSRAPLGAN